MIGRQFQNVAQRHSVQVALRTAGETWTYDQLDRRSNQIARAIDTQSGAPEEPVGLLLGHEMAMAAAILGTLKSGRPYVPLDPRYPRDRLAGILSDAGANLLICGDAQAELARGLCSDQLKSLNLSTIGRYSEAPLDRHIPSSAVACILYTSGSTGRPKGVYRDHCSIVKFAGDYTGAAGISADDRLLLVAPFSFSASLSSLFGGLLSGASLHLFDVRERGLDELIEMIASWNITVWHSTPTLFRRMVAALPHGRRLRSLKLVRLGGEPVVPGDLTLLSDRFNEKCVLQVSYSSTETLIVCQEILRSGDEITDSLLPLGQPAIGVTIELKDDAGQPVRAGESGEIVVRSPFLAMGYWRQPDLTASRFRVDPANPTVRRFRTGDLGRILPDGRLVHLGRVDQQVKVRGFRIDRSEIQAVLTSYPGVSQAAVITRDDGTGGKKLAAYVVPKPDVQLDMAVLRRELAARLPDYMLPAALAALDALPLTPGGKLDEKLLSTPEFVRSHLIPDDKGCAQPAKTHTAEYALEYCHDNPAVVEVKAWDLTQCVSQPDDSTSKLVLDVNDSATGSDHNAKAKLADGG